MFVGTAQVAGAPYICYVMSILTMLLKPAESCKPMLVKPAESCKGGVSLFRT